MSDPSSQFVSLRCASRADRNKVVGILCDAFRDDPVHRLVFRNPRTHEYWLRFSMRESVDRAFSKGHVIVATASDGSEPVAAALWYPPPERDSFWWETYDPSVGELVLTWLRRSRFVFDWEAHWRHEQMEQFLTGLQPAEKLPYWQLAALAVRPTHQCRGIGTALLREGLARALTDRLPVFLRSWEQVMPFYERYRFASVMSKVLPGERLVCHALVWKPPEAPPPAASGP